MAAVRICRAYDQFHLFCPSINRSSDGDLSLPFVKSSGKNERLQEIKCKVLKGVLDDSTGEERTKYSSWSRSGCLNRPLTQALNLEEVKEFYGRGLLSIFAGTLLYSMHSCPPESLWKCLLDHAQKIRSSNYTHNIFAAVSQEIFKKQSGHGTAILQRLLAMHCGVILVASSIRIRPVKVIAVAISAQYWEENSNADYFKPCKAFRVRSNILVIGIP